MGKRIDLTGRRFDRWTVIYLGSFIDLAIAMRVRQQAELKYWGKIIAKED